MAYQHELNRRDVAQLPRLNLQLDHVEQRLRQDRRDRVEELRQQHHQVTPILGPRPRDDAHTADWDEAAGRLHQLDLAYGAMNPHEALRRLEDHGYRSEPGRSARLPGRHIATPTITTGVDDLGLSL